MIRFSFSDFLTGPVCVFAQQQAPYNDLIARSFRSPVIHPRGIHQIHGCFLNFLLILYKLKVPVSFFIYVSITIFYFLTTRGIDACCVPFLLLNAITTLVTYQIRSFEYPYSYIHIHCSRQSWRPDRILLVSNCSTCPIT